MRKLIEKIINREGGFVVDSGGPTKYGVTMNAWNEYARANSLATKTEDGMKALTSREAEAFYENWLARFKLSKIENEDLLDLLFDFVVNSGPSKAIKVAQECMGVPVDGALGPMTLDALNSRPKEAYYAILKKRGLFMADLAKDPKYAIYLRGWMNRLFNEFVREV